MSNVLIFAQFYSKTLYLSYKPVSTIVIYVFSFPVTPGLALLFVLDSLGTAGCRSLFPYTDKTVTRDTHVATTPLPQTASMLSMWTPAHMWIKHRKNLSKLFQTLLLENEKSMKRKLRQQTWRVMLQVMESHTNAWREWGNASQPYIRSPWPKDTWPATNAATDALLAKSHTPTHTLFTGHILPESLLPTASSLTQT